MIYTVDRVQFNERGELIFFEFFNNRTDDREFCNTKYKSMQNINNINLITINYDDYLNGNKIKVRHNNKRSNLKWEEYKKWFSNINETGKGSVSTGSKPLGSATINEGDPYIHEILNQIHKIDLSEDDNGLAITKNALGKKATYGFDFDIFDDIDKNIIEFLNNETKEKGKNPIDNINAHPMRYAWISEREQEAFKEKMKKQSPDWENPRKKDNRQKYISLWKSKQILGGNLYLVNYNKLDQNEDLSIIEVIDLDIDKGITYDISYKVTYEQLIEWLKLMDQKPSSAKANLDKYPKEIRDKEFWDKYYENQERYTIPKRSHIGTKYE